MPAEPDRVSVGSPGGAGGNEIEAARLALSKINDHAKYLAEPAWDLEGCALVGAQIFRLAGEAIAALDAVRRSPQGEDHEAVRVILDRIIDAASRAGADGTLPARTVRVECLRATYALRRASSPVSGTETGREDAASFLDDERDAILDRPVSGTEPEDHEAGVRRLATELQALVDWFNDAPFPRAERLLYDLSRAPRAIAAWVREEADSKDYGAACEWRNVADAIEREGEDHDWRCECGDLNRDHEAFCYRCGAGQPEDAWIDVRHGDVQAQSHGLAEQPDGRYSRFSAPVSGTEPDTATRRMLHNMSHREIADYVHRLETDTATLMEAGDRLAAAIRGLDSYAASSQTAPLERAQRALKRLDKALAGFSVDAGKASEER